MIASMRKPTMKPDDWTSAGPSMGKHRYFDTPGGVRWYCRVYCTGGQWFLEAWDARDDNAKSLCAKLGPFRTELAAMLQAELRVGI